MKACAFSGSHEKAGPLNKWIFDESEKKHIPSPVLKELTPETLRETTFYAKTRKYIKLHRKILGDYKFSLPGEPESV